MEKVRRVTRIIDIVVFIATTLAIAGVFHEGVSDGENIYENFFGTLLHRLSVFNKEQLIWHFDFYRIQLEVII